MPRCLDRYDSIHTVLSIPAARACIEREAPELIGVAHADPSMSAMAWGPMLETLLRFDRERASRVIGEVIQLGAPPAVEHSRHVEPDPLYDADSPHGSAAVMSPAEVVQNRRAEWAFRGPEHGNPFVDVEFTAVFSCGDEQFRVGGFYDGRGIYRVRLLPAKAGRWTFRTESTARSLDRIEGDFVVSASDEKGPVRVAGHGFGYAHGESFTPFGTTAYAWTHQPEALQQETLETLARAPFTKLRMCLFPKSYVFNENEPELFPFPRDSSGAWDTERFDLGYARHLERRIDDLAALGIQADLIFFHPYDRWGFSDLGAAADDRYLRYFVRRLAAFPNVWWSLANEYDLLTAKRPADWLRFGELVAREDHAHHLLSVHNWVDLHDASARWVTHCSIQSGSRDLASVVDEARSRWSKPVVIDEFGYEGDIEQGWGDLTAQDVMDRFWTVVMRGGVATHGETYRAPDDVLFWAKGGTLCGNAVSRIAFLKDLIEQAPGVMEPLPSYWETPWVGVPGQYILVYFGARQPGYSTIQIPDGMRARVDVIDAWNMSIEEVPGIHEGALTVELPTRPYVAIRVRAVDVDPRTTSLVASSSR